MAVDSAIDGHVADERHLWWSGGKQDHRARTEAEMADWYDHIDEERKAFIERQHLFFVATAPSDPEDRYPNLSPKGRNLVRVLGPNLVGYVDYPGSGNET